jgi:hypothetical protein
MLGGLETLMSYGLRMNPSFDANPDEQRQLAIRFAAALPLKGVRPGTPFDQQCEEDLLSWTRFSCGSGISPQSH